MPFRPEPKELSLPDKGFVPKDLVEELGVGEELMAEGWPDLDPMAMCLYAALRRVYNYEHGLAPDKQDAVYKQALEALDHAEGKD